MDSRRTTEPEVIESESDRARGGGGRDLRDVLRHLVVTDGGREDVSLSAIASAVEGSERLLPELLIALEDDATAVRIGAAWALCAVADEQPAAVEYLTARVAERVDGVSGSGTPGSSSGSPPSGRTDGDEPFEVGQVLSYLRGRYPGRVADALDAAAADGALGDASGRRSGPANRADESAGRVGDRGAARAGGAGGASVNETGAAETGSGDRSQIRTDGGTAAVETPNGEAGPEGKRIETDGGVPAGTVADLGDGRQVVRPSGEGGPARPPEPRHPGDVPTGSRREPPRSHPTHPDFDPDEASDERRDRATDRPPSTGSVASAADDASPRTDGTTSQTDGTAPATERPSAPDSAPVPDAPERPETPETFASVGALSSFDQLAAVREGTEERYANGYRCRAVADGDERGVAVRLFDRPEEGDRLAFREDLTDRLARWAALGDGERVVEPVEWGERPRPWVAAQPVDASLVDRDRPSVEDALRQAIELAEAVEYVHRHGAVHGAIDPQNVVYPGDGLAGLDRPMLDNVGLIHAFRSYFDPAAYLDPRFAAPEYYDDGFGPVDGATDVYGLGAVCYLLFAGRPPHTGSYSAVREGVLRGRPPAPSRVNDAVPEPVDDVLGTALAKQKRERYGSVEALRGDLRRVRDRLE